MHSLAAVQYIMRHALELQTERMVTVLGPVVDAADSHVSAQWPQATGLAICNSITECMLRVLCKTSDTSMGLDSQCLWYSALCLRLLGRLSLSLSRTNAPFPHAQGILNPIAMTSSWKCTDVESRGPADRKGYPQRPEPRRPHGPHPCSMLCSPVMLFDELNELICGIVHGDCPSNNLLAHIQVNLARCSTHIPAKAHRVKGCPKFQDITF